MTTLRHHKLTFGTTKALSELAVFSEQAGLFVEEGVDVRFRNFLAGKKAAQALQKGWVDVANLIDANVAMLSKHRKINVKLLGYTHLFYDSFLLANAKYITQEPQSLLGRRVGVMRGTSSHIFLLDFCQHYGLDIEAISQVDMRIDQMERALLQGDIDACSAWQPYALAIQQAAVRNDMPLTHFKNEGFSSFFICLAVNAKQLAKKHEAICRMARALERAAEQVAHSDDHAHKSLPTFAISASSPQPMPSAFWDQVQVHSRILAPGSSHTRQSLIDSMSLFI